MNKVFLFLIVGLLLTSCFSRNKKAINQESQSTDIRIINRHFTDRPFFLLATSGGESTVGAIDSVKSLHCDSEFLELRQITEYESVFWCRDSFDYEIAGFDRNGILRLSCCDEMANNEVSFFTRMDSCLYPGGKAEQDFRDYELAGKDSLIIVCHERFKRENRFLEEYIANNPVSPVFSEACKAKLAMDHWKALWINFMRQKKEQRETTEVKDSVLKDSLLFRQDGMLFSLDYRNNVYYYNNTLATITTGKERGSALELYRSAKCHFSGKTRDYLLYTLYVSMLDTKNPDLDSIVFFTDCVDKAYRERVQYRIKTENLKAEHSGYDFLQVDGKVVAWKDILKMNRGKLIYVDFWASWCQYCREALPASGKLHDEYKEKDIAFVYISTDHDCSAWENACKVEGMTDYPLSYCMLSEEGLIKDLKVQGIPRYVLYDKQGKLIDANAPRPGTDEVRSLFDRYLK